MRASSFTIEKIREILLSGKTTAEELTRKTLADIGEKDQSLQSFLFLTEDCALRQAREVDQMIRDGRELPPLAGVPIAVKDVILVEGERCTAASKVLENYVATYDATVTAKLKAAGAIICGKTNLDEFAMGSSTENSAFQKTRNPWDEERVPGGSSGGSAAAVGAGLVPVALGSDTGGSIRQPAGFCGVVGLKPTYGAVSRYGLMAMASSLDQIGPFAQTVDDCRTVFEVIKGKDSKDATSIPINQKSPAFAKAMVFDSEVFDRETQTESAQTRGAGKQTKNPKFDMSKLRIGLPQEYFSEGLDARIREVVMNVVRMLKRKGVDIVEISLPFSKYALACYYLVMPAEVSANLARYDGIRYGFSLPRRLTLDRYCDSRAQGFGPEPRRRILLGTFVLSHGYYDAYYGKAQKLRRVIFDDFQKAFTQVDVILTPTSPTLPFRFGERTKDPLAMYLSDIYTVSINLAGLPGISVNGGWIPAEEAQGKEENGKRLPVGVQLIGNLLQEETLFAVAKAIEEIPNS